MKKAERIQLYLRRAEKAEDRAAECERRAVEVEGTDRRAKIRRGVLLSHARSHRRATRIWRWRAEMLSQEVHDE